MKRRLVNYTYSKDFKLMEICYANYVSPGRDKRPFMFGLVTRDRRCYQTESGDSSIVEC
jgi:hypothetical protein